MNRQGAEQWKPRVLMIIDTYAIGGPGKVMLSFLKSGGNEACIPVIAAFWRGPERKWEFREAMEKENFAMAVLHQKHAFDPSVILSAMKLVRDHNISIVESHGYKGHIVCFAIKLVAGIPWVAYIHGWTNENRKIRLYNFLERQSVRFADRIVAVSENLRKRLNLQGKTLTICNAVEEMKAGNDQLSVRERYGLQEDDLLLGVVARLSPEKGHLDFVEAFKALSERCGNVKALLIGEGQEREKIARAISGHGLEGKIIMTGYQENISSFYSAFDVVVIPSLSEGMPLAALEAMMFAKPVVASNVGGVSEVVEDGVTGLLVEPQNPAALAEKIEILLADGAMIHRLGAAGAQRVKTEFNPRERAKKVAALYQEVIRCRS